MKKWIKKLSIVSLLLLGACAPTEDEEYLLEEVNEEADEVDVSASEEENESTEESETPGELVYSLEGIDLPSADDLPLNVDYIEINDNVPTFTTEELEITEAFFDFESLDELGRVGVADALLDEELMPPEQHERGGLSHITPSGWNQNSRGDEVSELVSGGWLYNRAHLIGHQMLGEPSDVAENLMTGTRQFNVNMIPFENYVASVVESGTQVRYRVTPVFDGDNLLAHGVVMEGFSLDEEGELGDELSFAIFVPNEQESIDLNYETGEWSVDGETTTTDETPDEEESSSNLESESTDSALSLINNGSYEELQNVSGIGPALSERIIEYRESNGGFNSLEEITNVSGIDTVVLEELKNNH